MRNSAVIMCLLFISLHANAQKEKCFPILKQPFIKPANLATSGVYLKRGPAKFHETRVLYLYSNGVFFHSLIKNSKIETQGRAIVDSMMGIDVEERRWGFGFYRINMDTLIISGVTPGYFLSQREFWEEKYLVQEGGIYALSNKDTNGYVFYPTKIKPDSTRAWFYNVSWYQKYK